MYYIIIFFIGFAALGAVINYFMGVSAVPQSFVYIGALLVIAIGMLIAGKLVTRRIRKNSAEEEQELDAARELDKENEKINERRTAEAKRQRRREADQAIAGYKEAMEELVDQYWQHQDKLTALDILGDDDLNIKTIDFLINTMEGRRADSIKEALLQYDAKRDKDSERAKRNWEAYLARQDEERRREEERQETLRNMRHQADMRDLERKRVEELEKLNKKLNY